MSTYGFEDLGGPVNEEGEHVTVTYFMGTNDIILGPIPACAELTIDGGDKNTATVRLTAKEVHRLRNVLAQAERRLS